MTWPRDPRAPTPEGEEAGYKECTAPNCPYMHFTYGGKKWYTLQQLPKYDGHEAHKQAQKFLRVGS